MTKRVGVEYSVDGAISLPEKTKGTLTFKRKEGDLEETLRDVSVQVVKRPGSSASFIQKKIYEISLTIQQKFFSSTWTLATIGEHDVWINKHSEHVALLDASQAHELHSKINEVEKQEFNISKGQKSKVRGEKLTISEIVQLKRNLDKLGVTITKDTQFHFDEVFGKKKISEIKLGDFGTGAFKKVDKVFSRNLNKIVAHAKPRESLGPKEKIETQKDLKKEYDYSQKYQAKGIKVVQYHKIKVVGKEVTGAISEACTEGDLGKIFENKNRTIQENKEGYQLLSQTILETKKIHDEGDVLRDMKPDNVFVTKNEKGEKEIRIGDLGMVASVDDDFRVCGSPNYVAPEIMDGRASKNSPKQDVWATGIMLYEYSTGKEFMNEESFKNIWTAREGGYLDQVKLEYAILMIEANKNIMNIQDEALKKVIQGYLRFDPEERKSLSEEDSKVVANLGK